MQPTMPISPSGKQVIGALSARAGFGPLIAVALTLLLAIGGMLVYLQGPLNGQFEHFFLPSKMFGVPAALQPHGITPMYTGHGESGWDGQFYYYIANDPFARGDTAAHMDANAYRYQRVGLSLLAKIAAKLTLQSWVSPLAYYLTSLAVVLLAVGMGALFFRRHGISPLWVLIWGLGFGTQVTQMNGLPDAAADGLLIIALLCLWQGKWLPYLLAATFAALTREAYTLVPACFALSALVLHIRAHGWASLRSGAHIKALLPNMGLHAVPVLAAILWQVFLHWRFGVAASAQASGILGWPMENIVTYLMGGLRNHHPLVGSGSAARGEAAGILCFLLLMAFSAWALIGLLMQGLARNETALAAKNPPLPHVFSLGLALAGLLLIAMYLCFGPTVMMHHTGYLKAANLFLFLLPFALCLTRRRIGRPVGLFLIGFTLFSGMLLWNRIASPPYVPPHALHYAATPPACLTQYKARLTPKAVELTAPPHSLLKRLFARTQPVLIRTEIRNTSNRPFEQYEGSGTVNASYHWLDAASGAVVMDGRRTALEDTLKPGETATLPIAVRMPRKAGAYILRLTLVQEGCRWFYTAEPASAYDIPFTIH